MMTAQPAASERVEDDAHVHARGGALDERRGERVTDLPGMEDVALERD